MTKGSLPVRGNRSFEDLKKRNEHGAEYWSARDLQPLLGYGQWRRFEDAIKRAVTSCKQSGNEPNYHFAGAGKPITGGKGAAQAGGQGGGHLRQRYMTIVDVSVGGKK